MKQLILAILPALMLCNFACFSGKSPGSDGTSGSQTQSLPESTKQTDSNKVSDNTGKQDSIMNTNKFTDLQNEAFKLHYDAIVIDTTYLTIGQVKGKVKDIIFDKRIKPIG